MRTNLVSRRASGIQLGLRSGVPAIFRQSDCRGLSRSVAVCRDGIDEGIPVGWGFRFEVWIVLGENLERDKGLEPSTSTLATRRLPFESCLFFRIRISPYFLVSGNFTAIKPATPAVSW